MSAPWPPPEIGVTYIRKCRQHFHLACATIDEDGEVDTLTFDNGLSFEEASFRLWTRR